MLGKCTIHSLILERTGARFWGVWQDGRWIGIYGSWRAAMARVAWEARA